MRRVLKVRICLHFKRVIRGMVRNGLLLYSITVAVDIVNAIHIYTILPSI